MTDFRFQICVFFNNFLKKHFSEEHLKHVRKRSRSDPESNPVPSLPSLPPLSVSQPIGLIPSQEIGSPELSYVSELDKNTGIISWQKRRFGFLFSLKKVKSKHCAYIVRASRDVFPQKRYFYKTSIVLILYVPAGTCFSQKHDFSVICADF